MIGALVSGLVGEAQMGHNPPSCASGAGRTARARPLCRSTMPPLQTYNPIVIGFVEGKGPVHIPLQAARDAYGQLPSDYGLLPEAEGRRARKALNLPVGLALMDLWREGKDLPEIVGKFFER